MLYSWKLWWWTPPLADLGRLAVHFTSLRNRTGTITLKTFKSFDAEDLWCIEARCFFQSSCLTQCPYAYPASSFHAASNFFLHAVRVREMTIEQRHSPPRPAPHMSHVSAYLMEMSFYYCWQLRDNIVVGKWAGFLLCLAHEQHHSQVNFSYQIFFIGDDTWALRIGILIPGCICRPGSMRRKKKQEKRKSLAL